MEKKLIGTKFEVGKTYKCENGIVAECMYAYEKGNYYYFFGKVIKGGFGWIMGNHYSFCGSGWVEHIEPKVTKEIRYPGGWSYV